MPASYYTSGILIFADCDLQLKWRNLHDCHVRYKKLREKRPGWATIFFLIFMQNSCHSQRTSVTFICGENSKVFCVPTIHMMWRIENRILVKKFTTFSNLNCTKFPEICFKEFRHVWQQRSDILNIFYDGEYSINYYIWLIINKRRKQCVLALQPYGSIFLSKWRSTFAGSSQW
jgi:hypothetical protein